MTSKGDERVRRRIHRTWCSLLFALLAVAVAPGLAGAQPPGSVRDKLAVVSGSDITLYEATENMRLLGKALLSRQSGPFRKATSELMGVARRGSPLCPPLDPATDPVNPCVVNATGTSDVNLTTGKGNIVGTVAVVVQEKIPGTTLDTPDSPEIVVKKGKFVGLIDFTHAFDGLPFGTVSALLVVDGGGVFPFTGVFRQPVPVSLPVSLGVSNPCPDTTDLTCAVYFGGFTATAAASVPVFTPVNANEFALGFPTVRFEIKFDPPSP